MKNGGDRVQLVGDSAEVVAFALMYEFLQNHRRVKTAVNGEDWYPSKDRLLRDYADFLAAVRTASQSAEPSPPARPEKSSRSHAVDAAEDSSYESGDGWDEEDREC